MTDRVKIYSELVSAVLRSQSEMVSPERLRMFMSRASNKYKLLKDIELDDDFNLSMPPVISNEEETLKSLFMIMACLFKALEMFLGSSKARSRIVKASDKFRAANPEIENTNLDRYLPKEEEEEKVVDDLKKEAMEADTADGYVPYYDEKKKEWVMKPADVVAEITGSGADITPVYEEHAKFKTRKKPREKIVKKRIPEKKAAMLKTYFLQEEFPVGESYLVEGSGEEKDMLCAQFVKEGLESGIEVIVILGYPVEKFQKQLEALGTAKGLFNKLKIIDWYTFKERLVSSVEKRGNRYLMPKDPKFMGTTLTEILQDMDPEKEKRSFVSFVSHALAFIDFETVYNFSQITRLKFKKSNITGLFTMETGQHSKDVVDAFKELFDGRISVREGISGANTWKMKTEMEFFDQKRETRKDLIIMRNSVVALDSRERETEISSPLEGELSALHQDKIHMWKNLGFDTSALEAAAERGGDVLERMVVKFEERVERALDLKKRLEAHDLAEFSSRVDAIRTMLKDVTLVEKAEEELEKLEARARSQIAKDEKRRDREKEIFRIRMEHWRRQGYNVSRLERVIGHDLETVNREFAAFRSVVNRLKEIEKELDVVDKRGHEREVEELLALIMDVDRIEEAEEKLSEIKRGLEIKHRIRQTAKSRRNELMDELFGWALQGYCVDLIDEIDLHRGDLASLEERFSILRNRIERLKRMEETLNTLAGSYDRNEEIEIRASLRDITKVEWVEDRVSELQSRARAMGKIEGDVLAVEANIDKIRELEDTWQKLKARLLAEARARQRTAPKGSDQ